MARLQKCWLASEAGLRCVATFTQQVNGWFLLFQVVSTSTKGRFPFDITLPLFLFLRVAKMIKQDKRRFRILTRTSCYGNCPLIVHQKYIPNKNRLTDLQYGDTLIYARERYVSQKLALIEIYRGLHLNTYPKR